MGTLNVFNISKKNVAAKHVHSQLLSIKCLKFCSQNSQLIATGGADGNVGLFDLSLKKFEPKYFKVHSNNCTSLDFSPSNVNILVSVGLDEALNFMDLREGKTVKTIYLDFPITAMGISEDGMNLVMGSYFGDL